MKGFWFEKGITGIDLFNVKKYLFCFIAIILRL